MAGDSLALMAWGLWATTTTLLKKNAPVVD